LVEETPEAGDRPERKVSNYSDGFLSDVPAKAEAPEPAESEDSAGSQSTEPQWNLSRTYAVTLYSSELSSGLDGAEKQQRAKARTYTVNLPKDPSLSPSSDSTPPPPRGAHRRRSSQVADFTSVSTPRRSSNSSIAVGGTKFHVWTDSDMLDVKTPEIAAQNAEAQAFIRVAFKPNSQPRRTRGYVYIEEAEKKVPLECLGFDLEYI
jgi:hypothetical protein